jgi:hypothetical protein
MKCTALQAPLPMWLVNVGEQSMSLPAQNIARGVGPSSPPLRSCTSRRRSSSLACRFCGSSASTCLKSARAPTPLPCGMRGGGRKGWG